MIRQNTTQNLDPYAKPQKIGKQALLNTLQKLRDEGEISWLITDSRSFEWSEINLKGTDFLKKLASLNFKQASVGVFYPRSKQMKYSSFTLK